MVCVPALFYSTALKVGGGLVANFLSFASVRYVHTSFSLLYRAGKEICIFLFLPRDFYRGQRKAAAAVVSLTVI